MIVPFTSGTATQSAQAASQITNAAPMTRKYDSSTYNYKKVVEATYNWETLQCHKCTTITTCAKTKNPWFGSKYCKTWNNPVETCEDINFN